MGSTRDVAEIYVVFSCRQFDGLGIDGACLGLVRVIVNSPFAIAVAIAPVSRTRVEGYHSIGSHLNIECAPVVFVGADACFAAYADGCHGDVT